MTATVAGRSRLAGALGLSLVASLVVVSGGSSEAATGHLTMYAIDGSGSGGFATPGVEDVTLYRVDPATADTTVVGPTGFSHVAALDVHPDGRIFGHANGEDEVGDADGRLLLIDRLTGEATEVGETDLQVPDMTFHGDGTLYAWDEYGTHPEASDYDNLWTLDLATGAATEVGDSGTNATQASGLAFDTEGTLWLKSQDDFMTVDPSTGVPTPQFTASDMLHNILAFGPDGTAYSVRRFADNPDTPEPDDPSSFLYTVDMDSGDVTLVGDMGVPYVSAIAFGSAPPVAEDDEAVVARGGEVSIDVLANDADPDGDPLSVEIVDLPSAGVVTVESDGTVTYAHHGVAGATDEFSYLVHDEVGPAAEPAIVTVAIDGVQAVVLGGTAVIGDVVEDTIDDLTDGAGPTRLFGDHRYATSAAVSAATFAPGVSRAFVAAAHGPTLFADALSGGPAAGRFGAPMLLVSQGSIAPEVGAELERLMPGEIVVLGGDAVVSAEVAAQLEGYTAGDVVRVGGDDRYDTAARVSSRYFEPGVDTVYVATGLDFPDALTAGAAAIQAGAPILLVASNSIPPATAAELERLAPESITVVGGSAAISGDVAAQLAAYTGGDVERLFGPDRFATAAAISADVFADGAPAAWFATGLNFPDALAGVSPAGLAGAPILLVAPDRITDPTQTEVTRLEALG